MTTQQQAQFLETVAGVRKALKRKAYESDSDDSIERNTNRGYKLKKRARFVRQGHLASQAVGPMAQREIGEHAGYHRAIISHIPPMVDDEGYDIDSDDDDEHLQEAMERRRENPYASVHLEQLLAPLTAVTDLPNHPTLSRPFTSKALTELATQGCDLMHKENKALWNVKPLLTKLLGDNTWAPCGIMEGPNDYDMFSEASVFFGLAPHSTPDSDGLTVTPAANGEGSGGNNALPAPAPVASGDAAGRDDGDRGVEHRNEDRSHGASGEDEAGPSSSKDKGKGKAKDRGVGRENDAPQIHGDASSSRDNGDGQRQSGEGTNGADANHANDQADDAEMVEAPETGESSTAAAARPSSKTPARPDADHADDDDDDHGGGGDSGGDNGNEDDDGSGNRAPSAAVAALAAAEAGDERPFIHPLFLVPRTARPDPNLGLNSEEAEEIRRLVQLYVQKQEEVCRGARRLYDGLLKADRLRKTVLKWAKAEAHCGPNRDLSDGEDWYDRDEWGLTEELKKGQDEEEEDQTAQQQQKKTRTRR